jgi:adenylate cyclase
VISENIARLHPPTGKQRVETIAQGVREHLEGILASAQFDGSSRSRDFLCFIVEEALGGRSDALTQALIAARVFGRKGDFDPALDPVVRVQAGRLRRSLERYYLLSSDTDSVRIELLKGTYAPVFSTPVTSGGGDITLKRVSLSQVNPTWPTVAIHRFEVSSADDVDVSNRIKDALITELCRYRDVRPVRHRDIEGRHAESAAVRFELRGRLIRDGQDWIVTAYLIDRSSGEQLWGDEYHTNPIKDRWPSGIEDVARIIAARIGAEHGVIVRLLTSQLGNAHSQVSHGYGALLRCYHFFFSRQALDLIPTVEGLKRLTSEEPESALAWTYLARIYQVNYAFEITDLPTPIDKAIGYAYQAVILEPTNSRVRCTLASALLCKGELQAAIDELEQALRHNTASLAYREIVGWLLALAGDWERGVAVMNDAMARNPYCLPHVRHGLWADHLRRGEFDRAYVAALEYRDSTFFWRELMMTCCLGHLGRQSEARAAAAELLRLKPNFAKRGRTLIGYYIKPPDLRDRVAEGLRKAGLVLA